MVTEIFLLYFVLLAVTGWLTHLALDELDFRIQRRRLLKMIAARIHEGEAE